MKTDATHVSLSSTLRHEVLLHFSNVFIFQMSFLLIYINLFSDYRFYPPSHNPTFTASTTFIKQIVSVAQTEVTATLFFLNLTREKTVASLPSGLLLKLKCLTQTAIAINAVTHLSSLIIVFTRPVQEGLIALWECDDESKDEASHDETQDVPAVSSKPRVDKLWRRVAGDQMVVGVILTTDSSV